MIVSRVTLKNWRNFQDLDVELSDRMFVVGANASGKSNFLDVFRFLRDIAKEGGGLQYAIGQRLGLSKLRCLAARREPDVEMAVELAEAVGRPAVWRYEIGIKQEVRGYRQPFLTYERVSREGRFIVERPSDQDKADLPRLTQTHLEQINANTEFRPIARFFASILYLHLVPQLLRFPNAFTGPEMPGDPFGRGFLARLARTPEKTRRARLRQIERALKAAVPHLDELADTKDAEGKPHLEAVYRHWRPHGARQMEDQFSDGTLRLIGLFWALLEGDALLLLEEPELSLNAAIVRRLPSLIHQLQRKRPRQIILTTHSEELLSDPSIGGETVLLLRPDTEGTRASLASSNREIRDLLRNGLSVADAVLPHTRPERVEQLLLFR